MGHAPKFGRMRQLGMVFSEHLTYAFNDPQAAREGIICATQSCRWGAMGWGATPRCLGRRTRDLIGDGLYPFGTSTGNSKTPYG
ncbi:hypothetical protein ABT120_36175 [Nonomuraea angiospora]|uniref:hypothetical protein n=1 Tax=Nonomuraea angiospora TaxID=46172 RepID=UPI00331740E2